VPYPQSQIPLLKDIFERPALSKVEGIRITLGALATSLGVTVSQLAPMVREGLLKKRSEENLITSRTLIDAVPEPALTWMKGWFLPARAKQLFSVENLSDLLGIPMREVLPLAARHDVPVQREPSLGFTFSVWAARTLIERCLRSREHAQRFDRIALLHMLLGESPEKAAAPPVFDEELEAELARVAQLEEPTRGLRTIEILSALNDARMLAESAIRARVPGSPSVSGSEQDDVSAPSS
jgi:hypothetical protein